jgi:hypothetical protein
VVVDAWRLSFDNAIEVMEWCGALPAYGRGVLIGIRIKTLEGTMMADLGDWIICGVQGEFYPCKPDIFEATYEPV